MRKIITISILFFSYSCFSQEKIMEKKSAAKSSVLDYLHSSTVQNEETQSLIIINDEQTVYSGSYKRKSNEITENPLYNNIRLALPSNFNWLHFSLV